MMLRYIIALVGLSLLALTACKENTSPSAPLVVAWRTTLPVNPQQYWQGRPAADLTRVIVQAGNQLFSLDAVTGAIQWQYAVRITPVPPPTTPLIDAGRVFLAEVDSTFALDSRTGTRLWTFHPDSQGVVVPAVDASSIYIGQRGIPTVYALDKATGALRWRRNLGPGYVYGAAVRGLAARGDTVYATVWRDKAANGYLSSGVLVALDRIDGHELWRYETSGDRSTFVAEPLLTSDAILVNDFAGGNVTSLDLRTQTVRWRTPAITAYMALGSGRIYGAAYNGGAYGMDASTGAIRWTTTLGSSAFGIAVCGSDVFANNGNLHRLDPTSGGETGRLSANGLDLFSTEVGSDGKRVYVTGGAVVTAVNCN